MHSLFKAVSRSVALMLFTAMVPCSAGIPDTGEFAPSEPLVGESEHPFHDAVSLIGSWQFQPRDVPAGHAAGQGVPPDLTPPAAGGWDKVPIKIPSPWNVNTWGSGRHTGEGTDRPYWPDSIYYPSYPESWDTVKMGWLRRGFAVPRQWQGRRFILHFDAVAGDCEVKVWQTSS